MGSFGTINCEIYSFSDSDHLQQIYVGYNVLQKNGIIRVCQKIKKQNVIDREKPMHLWESKKAHLKVVLNNSIVVYYDVHDSGEVDNEILQQVDYYFKRSYSESVIDDARLKKKIFPLGLNYCVYDNDFDFNIIKRVILNSGLDRVANVVRGLRLDSILYNHPYTPRIKDFEFYPDFNAEPKILFMCRTWDPSIGGSKQKYHEIEIINETRAQCIRMLKKEFGKYFFGGFADDSYSRKYYSDCIIANNSLSNKKNYMELLKYYPICIATTGLHGSIGWKLAEYVAYSKAIVSERLLYEVPGEFRNGSNYLEYDKPADCVEKTLKIFKDNYLRNHIMIKNYRYYRSFLRPDSLVLNTINIAINKQGNVM